MGLLHPTAISEFTILQHGIRGCGLSTAVEIALRTDFGARLCRCVAQDAPALQQWRNDLIFTLGTNPGLILSRGHPTVAAAIPADFPDLRILDLYCNPVTSPESTTSPSLLWKSPNIPKLSQFLEESFSWASGSGILDDFTKHVFPGLALRELVVDALANDGEVVIVEDIAPYRFSRSLAPTRRCTRTEAGEVKISLSISLAFIDDVTSHLQGTWDTEESTHRMQERWRNAGCRITCWVPKGCIQLSE